MSKITILIVEDEAIVATDLSNKLVQLGYLVAGTAVRGDEAVELADRLRPQLVLMDIQLMGGPLDGIQAAEAIRSRHDIPVIFLTAHSDPATLTRAKVSGPFGYILKPFDERDLATQIELALYKHQADRQLHDQREWLRVTLTSIGDAVIATDAEGRVSFINTVAELLTGWRVDAALNRPVTEVFRIINEKTGCPVEEPVARVLREGRVVPLANHTAVVTRDGRKVPIEDSAAPILDAKGQVIGAVLVFHDVTEKRRTEQALQQTERKYRELVRYAPAAIYEIDFRLRRFTSVNDAMCHMCGYREEELLAMDPLDMLDDEGQTLFQERMIRWLHGKKSAPSVEYKIKPKTGPKIDAILNVTFKADENGKPLGATVVGYDITERKQAERRLARRTAVLEGINRILIKALTCRDEEELGRICLAVAEGVTSSHFGFIRAFSRDGRLDDLAISSAGLKACGMANPDGHRSVSAGSSLQGFYRGILQDGKGCFTNTPDRHPDSIGIPDGHPPLDAFMGVALMHDGKVIGILGVANRPGGYRDADLRELEILTPAIVQALLHKRAGQMLRESEKDLKRAQAVAETGSWQIDTRRNQLVWSDETYRIFDVPIGTAMTYDAFLALVHPDDRKYVDRQWLAALKGEPYDIEHRIMVGGKVRWVRERAGLEVDENGVLKGGFGTSQDITERRRTQEALHESNQELNEFAYALTHNVKTPFRAVQNYADFLTEDLVDILEGETKQYLEGIKKAVMQANNQFKDLEALYRIKNYSIDFEPFEMRELLHEMQSIYKNDPGRKLIIAESWPELICCKFLLRQILVDLINNGFKYNRADLKIVEVGWQNAMDEGIEIFVQDNGIGIDPRYHQQIFEIFKRLHTEREYKGTGIGLAVVKRAVQNLKGKLRVESAVGEGCTFFVHLPESILGNTNMAKTPRRRNSETGRTDRADVPSD